MCDIDSIYEMLDWNNSIDIQRQGIKNALCSGLIEPFLQPCSFKYNKNIWENCSIILSEKSDTELKLFLIPLMEWLEDLNWPGAINILNRLNCYSNNSDLYRAYCKCMRIASSSENYQWIDNLSLINIQDFKNVGIDNE